MSEMKKPNANSTLLEILVISVQPREPLSLCPVFSIKFLARV